MVEGGDEAFECFVVTVVGEVGALFFGVLVIGEVEGVGLAASAHRHVGPLPVGGPGDDHEGAVGSDPLSFVTGQGVAVVDVLVEVPGGQARVSNGLCKRLGCDLIGGHCDHD